MNAQALQVQQEPQTPANLLTLAVQQGPAWSNWKS